MYLMGYIKCNYRIFARARTWNGGEVEMLWAYPPPANVPSFAIHELHQKIRMDSVQQRPDPSQLFVA